MARTNGCEQHPHLINNDEYPFNVFRTSLDWNPLFHPHWHDQVFEMIYMVEGCADFRIGSASFVAAPGDIYLIPEGELHAGYVMDMHPLYYAILFDRRHIMSPYLKTLNNESMLNGHFHPPACLKPGDEDYELLVAPIQSIIAEFTERRPAFEIALRAHLSMLTLTMLRLYLGPKRSSRLEAANRRNIEKLKEVMLFVENGYADTITIEEAAAVAKMSRFHFCRTFKQTTGRTFIEFLNQYRIDKAEELIAETELNITHIAEKVGFGSINYFSRLFRKYKYMSPAQCRRRARGTTLRS